MSACAGETDKNMVLLNKLFTGSWLENPMHVDHGIVNMFRADPGSDDPNDKKSYLYITPNGNVPDADAVESVIFVQNIAGAGEVIEVIAMAPKVKVNKDIDSSNIKYGEAALSKLFENDFDSKAPITFEAVDGVFIPKRRVFLTTRDKKDRGDFPKDAIVLFFASKNKSLISRMRAYYSSNKEKDVYKKIKKLVAAKKMSELEKSFDSSARVPSGVDRDEALWGPLSSCFSEISVDDQVASLQPSFLEIINKTRDELTFSNLLKYYFELNRAAFIDFAKEVLRKETTSGKALYPIFSEEEKFRVVRESMSNIDLWIEDSNNIVVIENKIKSGIQVYVDNEEWSSQLEKYYKKTEEYKEKHSTHQKTWYYVLVPTYNKINLEQYSYGDKFTQITYGQLYDFFHSHQEEYCNDPYFKDFLKGLKGLALSPAGLNYEIAKARFSKMIQDAKPINAKNSNASAKR